MMHEAEGGRRIRCPWSLTVHCSCQKTRWMESISLTRTTIIIMISKKFKVMYVVHLRFTSTCSMAAVVRDNSQGTNSSPFAFGNHFRQRLEPPSYSVRKHAAVYHTYMHSTHVRRNTRALCDAMSSCQLRRNTAVPWILNSTSWAGWHYSVLTLIICIVMSHWRKQDLAFDSQLVSTCRGVASPPFIRVSLSFQKYMHADHVS